MAKLIVESFGTSGVNVDKNPLELDDSELTQAQNATGTDPTSGRASLRKRPGLVAFNTTLLSGAVLGGIGVPLLDLSHGGTVRLYIGRGPTS